MQINHNYLGDCLEIMPTFPDEAFDMILCDLPYGTTNCKWDSVIDLDKLWQQYNRIIKPNGAIVLTAQTPFDKLLGASNLEMLRYEWIWEKTQATGFLNANKMPMKAHENILVFYKNLPTYNPQKTQGHKPINSYTKYVETQNNTELYGKMNKEIQGGGDTDRFPRSIVVFPSDKQTDYQHPTQKPVPLFEYFIRTYTNEGDLVLDNCAGCGTTARGCIRTKRNFVVIEKEEKYWKMINRNIHQERQQLRLF